MTSIAIIGAGPRGISVIERLAALLQEVADPPALTLHVIDDAQHGAGRIWETDQTRTLCMNTLAGAVTLFTEPGSSVAAPVVEGPHLYDWVRAIRGDDSADFPLIDEHPPAPAIARDFAEELANTVPQSHPSRALYGAYLSWVYDVAISRLPDGVEVVNHRQRAVAITGTSNDSHDTITLSDGTVLTAEQTVLATGWTVPGLTQREEELAATGLPWIRPDNPLDQDYSQLSSGATTLVRGLGMGFFDLMALVTIDRGGRFIADDTTRSGLRYEPSGNEPHLVVTSGRGYPYLPKSDFGGLPPAARLTRLKRAINKLGATGSFNYDTDVWPAVVRDAYEAYYRVLSRVRPEALQLSFEDIVGYIDDTEISEIANALKEYTSEPFDLFSWINPLAGVHGSLQQVTEHIAGRMARDIHEAKLGVDSPVKAALWSVSASRKPSQILGAQGRMTWESRANTFSTMMSLGQMVGSGPPLFRTQQLLALVDAGLVEFLGQRPQVWTQARQWVAGSESVDGEVHSPVLVDAFMHSPDFRRPSDPVFTSLGDRIRMFSQTGSPEVDPQSRRIVHADGVVDQRVHVIGIPTHGQLPDTTISPMPGTDSLMLQETDATAVDIIRNITAKE